MKQMPEKENEEYTIKSLKYHSKVILFRLGNGKFSCRKEITLHSENSSSVLTAIIGVQLKVEQSEQCKYSHFIIM